jgi:tetratricopeptide (TPR) repeat protein
MARTDSETTNWLAAIALANQAVQCLEQRHETIRAEFAWSLHELAVAYVRDDRSREAGPPCEQAINLLGMTLRTGHPDEAAVLLTQAEFWISRRRPDQALIAINRARTLYGQICYRDGFAYARMLRLEAEAHQAEHNSNCAMRCFLSADKIWRNQETQLNCSHSEQSLILLGLAVVNVSVGAIHHADMSFAKLRPMLIALKGNAARAGFELNRRGNLFQMLCLYEEADWLYCRAEQLYCDCYGTNHPFTEQVRANRVTVNQRKAAAMKCPPMCTCKHPSCGHCRDCNSRF